MSGKVWLVGAGPGDPGLITVRGRQAIQRADVVIYDQFVAPEFAGLAPDGAEVVFLGGQSGLPAMSEQEVGDLIARHAGEGRQVVRLYGGDPFVFGRGGEEGAALRRAGITFEIVNGVTSSVAAPAYAGIPITYRGVASSFAVATGADNPDDPAAGVDWAKLATATDTLVMVYAADNLAPMTAALIRHGRPATTPVAVVSWATNARQLTVVGTLADIAGRVAEAGMRAPVITVVGDVVRLRGQLRWYDDRPLFGKRVLVTRTRQQAGALRHLLREEGAAVVELPTLEIMEAAAPEIIGRMMDSLRDGQYAWVVFTGVNAVDRFFRHLEELGRDARSFGATRVLALGPGVVEALARHGIRADAVANEATGKTIPGTLSGYAMGRRRVLVPRVETTPPGLITAIRKLGAEVEDIPLYVSALPRLPNQESLSLLRQGEVDVVTFTSSWAVDNLITFLGGDAGPLRRTTLACLGELTAEAARAHGLTPDVVIDSLSIDDLVQGLRTHLGGAGSG